MYGRFANAPNKYQIYIPSPKKVAFAACSSLRKGNGVAIAFKLCYVRAFCKRPHKYQIYLIKKVAFAACPLPSGGERGRHFKTSCWIKFFYFKISCTFVAYSLKLNSNE